MRVRRADTGQIMPMVALLMLVIIGMAAFAIDGSNIYSQHRKLQADLDVAVKVAASEMWDFNPSDSAYTSTAKTAIADAAQILANDGYSSTLTISTSANIAPSGGGFCGNDASAGLLLCNPPQTGPFAGSPHYDYVAGRLSRDVGGFFGGAIGLGTMHISVRAVAWHGGYHQPYSLLALDSTAGTCVVSGGSGLTVNGSVIGNAVTCGGTGPIVTGHSDEHGSGNADQIVGNSGTTQNVLPVTDPYSPTNVTSITQTEAVTTVAAGSLVPSQCAAEMDNYLPLPPPASWSTTPVPSNTTVYFPPADGSPGLSPLTGDLPGNAGVNDFMPLCDGTATGSPGVYFWQYVHTPGQVFINSFDSTFVWDSSGGGLMKSSGQSNWSLHAPTSGPYAGIAVSQTRTGAEPPCPVLNSIDFRGGGGGQGVITVNGVVDLPCTQFSALGSSTVTVNGVMVGYDVSQGGSSTVTVNYDPSLTPPDKGSVLVE